MPTWHATFTRKARALHVLAGEISHIPTEIGLCVRGKVWLLDHVLPCRSMDRIGDPTRGVRALGGKEGCWE